jgi:hypothetical protein
MGENGRDSERRQIVSEEVREGETRKVGRVACPLVDAIFDNSSN